MFFLCVKHVCSFMLTCAEHVYNTCGHFFCVPYFKYMYLSTHWYYSREIYDSKKWTIFILSWCQAIILSKCFSFAARMTMVCHKFRIMSSNSLGEHLHFRHFICQNPALKSDNYFQKKFQVNNDWLTDWLISVSWRISRKNI